MLNYWNRYPPIIFIGTTIIIAVNLVFMGIALYTPYFNILVLLPPMGISSYIFIRNYGEYLSAFHSNPIVFFGDGTWATLIGNPVPIGAGKIRFTVALQSRLTPEDKRMFLNNVDGLATVFTGDVNMAIETPSDWFVPVPPTIRNPKEDAYFYYGDIYGNFVGIPNDFLLKMQEEYNYKQRVAYNNFISKLNSAMSSLSKTNNKDILIATQVISSVIKDMSESQYPAYNAALQAQAAMQAYTPQVTKKNV